MPNYLLQQFSVLLLILIIISLRSFSHAYNHCQDDQKTLLLELKNELIFNSSISRKLVRWSQADDCCKWEGVGCDASGHVMSLQLDYEGISGGIESSSSLVSLEYLEKLNLAHNSLNGTIPSLNLTSLVELDLSSNQLEGPISDSFFINLQRLELLSLSDNLFDNTFQLEDLQSLHNLTTLNLSRNNLSLDASTINSNWSRFSKLKKLSLASCNLQKIPDFIKESNLNFLDLSENQIRGEIPSWIWGIGNGGLYHLNLSRNDLVDLQKPYTIPSFLGELDLHSNRLRGELPLLPHGASYVDFSDNKFDKPIPLSFVSFNFHLIFLSIASNIISGSIPTSICSAEFIQFLDLSLNNLSGSIPPCLVERTSSLQMLNLRRNNISGDIPDKFSSSCGMRILDLNSNNLGGNFPKSLEHCTSLWFVDVGRNKIGGGFPCMLSSRLKVLDLRLNRFHGEVKCGESWPNLQVMDISFNNFSGYLHHISFSSWKKMSDGGLAEARNLGIVNVKSNYLTQVIFTFRGFHHSFPSQFTVLDFSSNEFHGEIPESIGGLSSLVALNLSHNALTGRIPKSLGNLAYLEALDLSVNDLSGTIPEELTNLSFLSVLNLSYNKLVGEIPNANQFLTFESSSYQGNAGLCGSPLTIRCSDIEDSAKLGNMQPRGKAEMEWYYMFLLLLASVYFQVLY